MKRNFGHEDAGNASDETLDTIVETYDINQFLTTNSRRYIVGCKGSGKTLLLLKKAIKQRERNDGLCIPSGPGNPVDRLLASWHVGRRFNQRLSEEDANLAWATVWKHSILSSVLFHLREECLSHLASEKPGTAGAKAKATGADWGQRIDSQRVKEARGLVDSLLDQGSALRGTPFEFFTQVADRLDSGTHKDVSAHALEVQKLHHLLASIRTPVYVFLDNLDDYYEDSPDLWTRSMYGQLRAIREIGLGNSNIHVFTSIRQDVFEQFQDEMTLQYYSYVAFLKYEKQHLVQIFETSIKELDDDLLKRPGYRTSNPWSAFFGDLSSPNGASSEPVEKWMPDYLFENTLGRPRDVIHLGNTLLSERPIGGAFTMPVVRRAIRRAKDHIAVQYLQEIKPLLDPRFSIIEFVECLPGDVIQRRELDSIVSAYKAKKAQIDGAGIDDAPHDASDLSMPFETLYGLGLLGCPTRGDQEHPMGDTRFRPVGYGLPEHSMRMLPRSDRYVLHPVLQSWLGPTAQISTWGEGSNPPIRYGDA